MKLKDILDKAKFAENKLNLQFFKDQTNAELACAESGALRENTRLMPLIKAQNEMIEYLISSLQCTAQMIETVDPDNRSPVESDINPHILGTFIGFDELLEKTLKS